MAINRNRRAALVAVLLALAIAAGLWRCHAGRDAGPAGGASPAAREAPRPDDAERRRRIDDRRRGLAPALARLALAGVVVDAAGAPVEGADVILAAPPLQTRSGADGRFRFEGLTEGTYVVEARAGDGYAGPVKARAAPVADPVTLRLYQGGRVEVRCVAEATGAPIAGARVGIRMSSMFPGAIDLEAVTDRDGAATFRGMPAAGLEAWCAALGHAIATRGVDSTQEGTWHATVELAAGTPVRGQVVDERGAPVEGATIEVAAAQMPALAGVKGAVRSGADGGFVLPGVAPGRWMIHADHPGHELGIAQVDVPERGEAPPVTVVVGDGVTVAGVVATAALEPAPGATIEVRFRAGGRVFRTFQADGTGHFVARGLPLDELQLVALHDRAASPPAAVDTRDARDRDDLVLTLDDDQLISGVVVDADGSPLPDVSVFFVHDLGDDARATAAGVEVTGPDGRFELHGLAADTEYVLTAMRPGHFAAVSLAMRSVGVRVRAGDDVTIRMPADGAIRGRVVMTDGGPPPGDLRVRLGGIPQRVAADGGFLIEGLPPEHHHVRIDAPAVPELVLGDVEVRPGETTDLGDLELTRGRQVSGTVLDDARRPIGGAEVRFVPVGIQGLLTAETDRRGRFSRPLPTDRDCDVHAVAGDLGATAPVRVAAGRDAATVDLRFGATGRIAGVVRSAGRPAAGRYVLLDRGDGDAPPASMATTGADGRYELVVAGGTYRVSLVAPGEGGSDRFVDRTVTVEAGGEARVDLED